MKEDLLGKTINQCIKHYTTAEMSQAGLLRDTHMGNRSLNRETRYLSQVRWLKRPPPSSSKTIGHFTPTHNNMFRARRKKPGHIPCAACYILCTECWLTTQVP